MEISNSIGFLLIDKPAGITSHDVISRLRRITGIKRIGHAGTLDPFATGLLLIGVEREATREMQKLVGLDKKYEASFVLGISSTTDDIKGELSEPVSTEHISKQQIQEALHKFVGKIDQVPPTYAAIKIQGKKLYELAREGNPTLVAPRHITIYSINLLLHSISKDLNQQTSTIHLSIHCSSGTYIRSIARDLGDTLGVGGYVETLRRTSIGPFQVKDAFKLDQLSGDSWQSSLISVPAFLSQL